MNDTGDLVKARGELRQFMRALQEDAAKNVIPYGNEATLSDNVWVSHAEVTLQFVRLHPQWQPFVETLAKDSTRTYRLNRQQWLDAQAKTVARVDTAKKADVEPLRFVLETEPTASAFQDLLKLRCENNIKLEAEQDAHGAWVVRVWPQSAAEGEAFRWLHEAFQRGYHSGKKKSQGAKRKKSS
jgi:hypothetical protein